MTFKDLESLKLYLEEDGKKVSLNPVRFISVDSLSMWINVKKVLISISDESLHISKFCENKDTTPNVGRLLSYIKKSDRSLFVTPLSEYLRIKPDIAEVTIRRIIKSDFQNVDNGKMRIYFLMYRIKSVLRTISLDDPRAQDTILYLETDEESDYRLTIVQRNIGVSLPGNEIYGFKSYLEYWEANPDKPLILYTDNAIHFEKNQFFDDVRVIITSFDLIKEQYGIPNIIQGDFGSDSNWNDLAKVIVNEESFEAACCSILSINKYSLQLFDRWCNYSEFQRWVLWIWSKLQLSVSYHIICAKKSLKYTEFIDLLYCHILDYIDSSDYVSVYLERKHLLKAMEITPTGCFWSAISGIDRISALACLTDLTDIERKTIFDLISSISFENRTPILEVLRTVYPKLYNYLNNEDNPNEAGLSLKFYTYFQEYKWLKATDTITVSFLETVNKFALEKGESVFSMPTRNSFITINYNENTLILFVDGMGIEYTDYLAHLFLNLDSSEYSTRIEAGYCTLPSITEINKDFINGRNAIEPPVRDLDELKHASNPHPDSIIKQLHILDDLKDKVFGSFSGSAKRVIITSDHGTSRLAVKVRGTAYDNVIPKPIGLNIYRYGRFCEEGLNETTYPTAININDYLIFADYSRFSQSGAPTDEIHGGASLEEWIVPVVIIDKINKKINQEQIVIKPEKDSYRPALGTKQISVAFSISEKVRDSIIVSINGTRVNCTYSNEMYRFDYKVNNNEENLTVKVLDGTIIGQFKINIDQPIKMNTKFNI